MTNQSELMIDDQWDGTDIEPGHPRNIGKKTNEVPECEQVAPALERPNGSLKGVPSRKHESF